MQTRMEAAENKYVVMAATILNCEGWERKNENGEEDEEFADNYVAALFDHLREPLLKAGLDVTLNSLLEQWHDLVAYATRYLDPSRTHYLGVWKESSIQAGKTGGTWCYCWSNFSSPFPSLMRKLKGFSR